MFEAGSFNPSHPAERFGLRGLKGIFYNLDAPHLAEDSFRRGETVLAKGGALVAETGVHTGRSPKDKFIVRDALTDADALVGKQQCRWRPSLSTASMPTCSPTPKGMDLFVQDLYGGADPAHRVKVRVITEYAWHSLFIRNLLIRPSRAEQASFVPD